MDGLVPFNDFFGDLDEMRKRLDRIFSIVPYQAGKLGKELKGGWYPAVDIQETEKEIIVKAELPGISEKDINLEVTPDSLSLSGHRKDYTEIEDKKAGYVRRERSFGKFSRSFTLPAQVSPDKSEANFEQGVLKIKLPKVEKSKPKGKRIDIKKK